VNTRHQWHAPDDSPGYSFIPRGESEVNPALPPLAPGKAMGPAWL